MKYFTIFSLLLLPVLAAFGQQHLNMERLAAWDDESLPVADPAGLHVQYSGCWGYAQNGREYAILGGAQHVLFFDVTNPSTPVLIGKFAGGAPTIWREFKTYKNRIYASTDGLADGLMIFDMSDAPDTIYRTYYNTEFLNTAHTLTLDTTSGRLYMNGSNVANIVVLDIATNPDHPQLLASLSLPGGYIHDSYVRGDTLYASHGWNGLYIHDLHDLSNPVTLASISTGGYNHNNWLDKSGRYCYYTEEVPDGKTIKVVDLINMGTGDLTVVHEFLDPLLGTLMPNAIAHNVIVDGDILYVAQYEDGVLMYDIANPVNPALIGYFDTHPENTQYNTYYGCWGAYPSLPSGTIIASDMQNGLQLLRSTVVPVKNPEREPTFQIAPNPATDVLLVQLDKTLEGQDVQMSVYGMSGNLALTASNSGKSTCRLDISHLPADLYMLEVRRENGSQECRKFVKN